MAKTKKGASPEEELNEQEFNETPDQPNEEAPEVAPVGGNTEEVAEVAITTTIKKVTITALCDIDCWVGGVHYVIRDKKQMAVPSDVAAILTTGRKAYRN